MRELKFRAWHEGFKEMDYELEKEMYYGCGLNSLVRYMQDPHGWILMQFTGLSDKHGNEIYEGDRFLMNEDDDEWYDHVIWDTRRATFDLDGHRDPATTISLLEAIKMDNCRIIGNIYEESDG